MPKIIGRSLGEHREQMQNRIFTAFADLLTSSGYDAITLADVAARVGLGRTAIYNYYPDKEDLLLAFSAHATEDYLERLHHELMLVTNPVDQLRTYVRMQAKELATQHVPTTMAGVLAQTSRERLLEHVRPLILLLDSILQRCIQERYLPDGDRRLMGHLVNSSASGRWIAELDDDALEQALDSTAEFVLRGLGVRLDTHGRPRRLPAAR